METHRGFEPRDIELLQAAHDAILHLSDRDCDCDWQDGVPTDDTTSCDVCQARRAQRALDQVLDPEWKSCSPERMTNLEERVYVEEWRKENVRHPGINGGYGTLELLLVKQYRKDLIARHRPVVLHVTQRDMEVAASIVQWLGTNCGLGFLQRCEERIKKEKGVQRLFGTNGYGGENVTPAPNMTEVAQQIAENFISVDKNPHAVDGLRRAIETAIVKFQEMAFQKS